MNKALLLKRNLKGYRGIANFYQLVPPYEYQDYDDTKKTIEYVIVSTAVAFLSGVETYIFPANSDGKIRGWGELPGSTRGSTTDENVLMKMGEYEIVESLV